MFLGRIPRRGEPLWTDDDRDWAMALLAYEADQCPGCGQSRAETTLPENEDAYTAAAIRCHGCKAVAHGSEPFTAPGADPRGLLISVTKGRRSDG